MKFVVNKNKLIMKNKLLNILTIASVLTIIGFLMDGDVKEPNMTMRFVEFIIMLGITFIFISLVYFMFDFAKKSFLKA